MDWSHLDSIWVPDDVITAWFSAGYVVSPMVSIDMGLQMASGQVFSTVWTNHPFLLPVFPPFKPPCFREIGLARVLCSVL